MGPVECADELADGTREIFAKKGVAGELEGVYILPVGFRGRSSEVEHHVANVGVVSSNLIARCRSFS